MSTYLQMQDEVIAYGFDANVYRTRIKIWLNDAQAAIARKVEIPELFTSQAITAVIGTQGYNLNTDVVRIDSVIITLFGDRMPLVPLPHKQILISSDSLSLSLPEAYGLTSTQIILSPIPDLAYPFTVYYYKDPTDLSADGDISVLPIDYHKAMIRYATSEAFMSEDDEQMHAYHYSRYALALGELGTDRQAEIDDTPRQVSGTWGTW